MTERKLDIFRVLQAADEKNINFYANLTEEEQKEFQPFIVMRWLSGTFSARQVYFINELLNPYAFSLANHKQLLWQLMTISCSGKQQKHFWNKLPGKKETNKPNATKVIMEYYQYSSNDAIEVLPLFTRDDIVELAEQLGWQQEEIAKIKKEIKSNKDTPKQKTDNEPLTNGLLEF